MTHDWHEALPGYDPDHLLVDGCRECEERAARWDCGISTLDPQRFARAWDRARQWQEHGLPDMSDAEVPLLSVLSSVQVQLDRRGVTL